MTREELRERAARELKGKRIYRACRAEFKRLERQEGMADDEPAVYECSIASEEPCERWWGIEILDFSSAKNVDLRWMKAGGAVLLNHDTDDQIGVVDKCWVDTETHKLMVHFRFSRNAHPQEVERDWIDGIRRNVSVGYDYGDYELTKGEANAPDTYRITQFPVYEMSIVPIPADVTVGQGRSIWGEEVPNRGASAAAPEAAPGGAQREEKPMLITKRLEGGSGGAGGAATVTAGAEPPKPTERSLTVDDVNELLEMAEKHGLVEPVRAMVREKKHGRQEIADWMLHNIKSKPAPNVAAEVVSAMTDKERKDYRICKGIAMLADIRDGKGRWEGLEARVHDAIAAKMPGGSVRMGALLVPNNMDPDKPLRTRAMDTKTSGSGADLVMDQPGQLIEMLIQQTRAAQLGVTFLPGLVGNVPFPVETSVPSAQMVGENTGTDLSETEVGTGIRLLNAKTARSRVKFSRQLMVQSSIDIEAHVRRRITTAHSLKIDEQLFIGSGKDGQTLGAWYWPDAQAYDVLGTDGVPDYGDIVNAQAMLAEKNVPEDGWGFLFTAGIAGVLKQTPIAQAAGAVMIWQGGFGDGLVDGQRATYTGLLPKTLGTGSDEHAGLLARWRNFIVGLFGATEVLVNPYLLSGQAMVVVDSFQMFDTMAEYGDAIVKLVGLKMPA